MEPEKKREVAMLNITDQCLKAIESLTMHMRKAIVWIFHKFVRHSYFSNKYFIDKPLPLILTVSTIYTGPAVS